MSDHFTSRRSVLAAAGMAGLAASLTACGDGSDGADSADGEGGSEGESKGESKGEGKGEGDAESAGVLGRASDVPEGGGKVFKDRKVVVTQPSAGEFRAYSAMCTHKGCLVNEVADGTINCPCHGSKYDITDGSVQTGPARRSLAGRRVSVKDGTIRLV